MIDHAALLSGIPTTLRQELLEEFRGLVTNFYEGRWRPAELHAGRFCEVVYSILLGRAEGSYPATASKPSDFPKACRGLESKTSLERGLRVLAARILPGLYEIRNNRDVGHVGGDVDSNFMDATYAVSAGSWLMAELVRVFHSMSISDATKAVQQLTELRTPAVWVDAEVRRVLNPDLSLRDQCLLLIASAGSEVTIDRLIAWTEVKNKAYLRKVIAALHTSRKIEAANPEKEIKLLPAGAALVRNMLTEPVQ